MGSAHPIPGTTIFGPAEAMRGYALNAMCFSFNEARNREAFLKDELLKRGYQPVYTPTAPAITSLPSSAKRSGSATCWR